MRNETLKSQHFTRRALLVAGGQLLMLSALGGRLYYLQVVESDKYQTMANGNRVRVFPTLPKRGRLLDHQGKIIAEGHRRYQVLFEPLTLRGADTVLKKTAAMLEMDMNGQQALLKKLAKLHFGEALLVQDFVPWDKVTKVEVEAYALPGIRVTKPEVRYYPEGAVMGHLTGYVGMPDENDKLDEALLHYPEFRIGKTGLEERLEERLRGKPGLRQVEVDARGAYVRELSIDRGRSGEDVTLTIDLDMQRFMVEQLSGKGGLMKEGGSAVLLDVTNGHVLAMASVPGYDPNQFVRGIKQNYWDQLINDPDVPLTNKPTSSPYPPGSTFKTMTALAALHTGTATEDTSFFCPGFFQMGDRVFHCWNRNGHGTVNMPEAIMYSCNVYFFNIAKRLGVDPMMEMARQFGLGAPTGIELPGEKSGLLPTREWKRKTLGKPWVMGESLNAAIGQGYTLETPLQLAVQAARIATGGRKIIPTLIADAGLESYDLVQMDSGEKVLLPGKQREFGQVDIDPEHIRIVQKGMRMVVNDPRGGVYPLHLADPQYMFAGKTGTSQVLSNKTFKYVPTMKTERFHALFIGYAPVHDPRYAISVVIEHGGYGSGIAAPIARAILLKAQQDQVGV